MRSISTLSLLLPLALTAQTTWEVEAGGSTAPGAPTAPYYAPMELTIEVDDIVHWQGVSGSHNVYAMLDMFPANPEGFTSGQPTQGLDYSRTFTVPGVYGYHCTQEGHSLTQHGIITVNSTQNVEEVPGMGQLVLFPVPAEDHIDVELTGGTLRQAEVMALDGRILLSTLPMKKGRGTIELTGLPAGRYLLRITDANGRSLVRPFVKG